MAANQRSIMKICHKILFLGALLVSGCTVEPVVIQDDNGVTSVHAVFDNCSVTKISMVPTDAEDIYKVHWNEGDRIHINGICSESIEINEEASQAVFSFGQEVTLPYYGFYSGTTATSYSNGTYIVNLPEVQNLIGDDMFDSDAAVMFAYSETVSRVTFRHAMAYIRLSLEKGTTADNTAWVKISGRNGEAIAGVFSAGFTNGNWNFKGTEASKSEVTFNCGNAGAPLGTKMIIAIPAGQYDSGLKITIRDKGTHFQVKEALNSFTAEPGCIYDMTFVYTPDGTIIDGEIDSDLDNSVQENIQLTPYEKLNAGNSPINSHKDEWKQSSLVMDYRSHINITANNVNPSYPRIRTLADGSYILTWQNRHDSNGNGKHTLYALSKDLKNWEHMGYLWEGKSVTNSLGKSDTRLYTNANTLQLSNGEVMAVAAFRASSSYSRQDCRMDHGIIIKRSKDGGRTWFGEKVIYNGPCWEPHLIELHDGEIQCFFAESRPWISGSHSGTVMVYSKDGGATWSPELGNNAYRVMRKLWWNEYPKANGVIGEPMNCYTYQMPVGIILNDSKQFAFAMESVVERNKNSDGTVYDTFEIAMAYSKPDGTWVYMQEGEELPASQRKDGVASGAAPYIIQFPSGETLIAYAKSGYQQMQFGNSAANEFGSAFSGLPEYGSWGALDLTGSHSALSCIRNANDETIAIARYHLNHSITATSRSVIADGNKLEWENTDEALFVGSKSWVQSTLRCSADDQNYYFLIEIHDDEISADDRGYLMLSGSSLSTASRRVEFGIDGLKATKRYSTLRWSNHSFTAEVKTNQTLIDGGYWAEIKIPRSEISASGGKLKVNFGHYDAKTSTTDLLGNERSTSGWMDIKGL